jgi:3-oxoacyl-[acyl-carrier protein] reductase
MALEDFEAPIRTAVRTTFVTARAAARHMIPRGSGVIMAVGGEGDPLRNYYIGGTQIALCSATAVNIGCGSIVD